MLNLYVSNRYHDGRCSFCSLTMCSFCVILTLSRYSTSGASNQTCLPSVGSFWNAVVASRFHLGAPKILSHSRACSTIILLIFSMADHDSLKMPWILRNYLSIFLIELACVPTLEERWTDTIPLSKNVKKLANLHQRIRSFVGQITVAHLATDPQFVHFPWKYGDDEIRPTDTPIGMQEAQWSPTGSLLDLEGSNQLRGAQE